MDGEPESLGEWEETETRLKNLYARTRRGGWTWQAAGALAGLGSGVLAVAFGSLLSAVAWVRGHEAGGLPMHDVGNVLLLSTIPLLIFGAHCLDLLDERAEGARELAALDFSRGERVTSIHRRS